jgi:hypothetical protein
MKSLTLLVLILATVPVLAGVPVVSSLTPDHGPVSSTVTITGSQFSATAAENIVHFGTVRATVLSTSSTEITAVVPAAATNDPVSVTVGGLTGYSAKTFVVTFPYAPVDTGSYSHYFKLPTDASVRGGRALVDLDDDGRLDLVGPNDDNTVVVYRNVSQPGSLTAGSFASKQAFATGYRPYYVAAADFNSDGKTDLAVANNSGGSVSVLKNTSSTGAISFAGPQDYAAGGSPSAVEVGDFNGDGKIDMAVSNNGSWSVSVLINTGTDGMISFAPAIQLVTPSGCGNLAVADFDGDGKADIAVANGYQNLTIFRNATEQDSLAFSAPVTISTVNDPRTVAVGDIDGDGKSDIVMTSSIGPNAWVFRNTSSVGSLSFGSPLMLSTPGLAWYIALADLNGDGKLDLIVPNTANKVLSVFCNTSQDGSVSFAARVEYPSEYDMLVGAGDLDRDGLPDIVLGDFYGGTGFTVFPRKTSFTSHLLRVEDSNGNSGTLTFGLAAGATNGIDAGLGERDLPPVPPQGAFDTRFILPGNQYSSWTDFRPDTSLSPTWRILLQPGPSGYPMRLSWDSVQFVHDTWTLYDEVTGSIVNVNLNAQSAVEIVDSRATALILSYVSGTRTIGTTLRTGWNLVSVPLVVDDWSTTALFPGMLTPAYGFENSYVEKSIMEMGKGYWLKMPAPSAASFKGEKRASGVIDLVAGWNLVGPLEAEVSASALQSTPPGILVSSFFGFDGAYFPATTLLPGHGYWIQSSQSGTLDCRPSSAPTISLVDSLVAVDVTDAAGTRGSVYLARRPVASLYACMPPSAPVGASDMRFSDNTWVHYGIAGTNHQVHLANFVAPLSMCARNNAGWNIVVLDTLSATEFLLTDRPVSINRPLSTFSLVVTNVTSVGDRAATMPSSVRLNQNYPNPFNPSTTISFELPRRGFVRLEVFNTLGQQVGLLVHEEREAGYHQVRFDASGLSSGLYYYRLTAGDIVQTNRMALLK